jgi:hypothetical protein
MYRTDLEVNVTTWAQKKHAGAEDLPGAGGLYLGTRKVCAYNQTRECFLGLEVITADLSNANFQERVMALTLNSGEGLLMLPFCGVPETGMRSPIDLIYLDPDYRVIEAVESFPVSHFATLNQQPACVLALPTHSIYSSQTQTGDQLVICAADEMETSLERFSAASGAGFAVNAVAVLRQDPLWSGGPGLLQLEDQSREELAIPSPIHELPLVEPGSRANWPPKNWLQRWWSPDPRMAPRDPATGLAAYYWNGAAPQAHNVKDISASGLYLVTEERWYPGTLVMMTLQRTECGEENAERSISVHSRAVRWGNDGVGLQFVMAKPNLAHSGVTSAVDGLDKKELDRFLKRLRMGES